jgi:hypothetical protein
MAANQGVPEPTIKFVAVIDPSGAKYVEVSLQSGDGQPDQIYYSLTDVYDIDRQHSYLLKHNYV